MAIQHELSGDIAVALLAGEEKGPEELDHLKEVVLKIHAVLEELTTESHKTHSQAAGRHKQE